MAGVRARRVRLRCLEDPMGHDKHTTFHSSDDWTSTNTEPVTTIASEGFTPRREEPLFGTIDSTAARESEGWEVGLDEG